MNGTDHSHEDEPVKSPFEITENMSVINKPKGCQVQDDLMEDFVSAGFTKAICPYGALIIATPSYSNDLLNYAANTMAALLNPKNEKKPVEDLTKHVAIKTNRILAGTTTKDEDRAGFELQGVHYTSLDTYNSFTRSAQFKAITE